MKVFTEEPKAFKPITIVLETEEEVEELLKALYVSEGNIELYERLDNHLSYYK